MALPINLRSNASGVPPNRAEWALFNLGFRPFYLLAALLAAVSLPLWVVQFLGVLSGPTYFPGLVWHAHEMVFGFAVAVIVGFLFTAVRNWTGLPTPTGSRLAALAVLWIAGRVAMMTGPGVLAAMADGAFLPFVAWCLWRPLHAAKNRNRLFVAILLAMAALNVGFHVASAGAMAAAPLVFVEAALGFVLLVVAIMAGRVVPMFTRNAVPVARIRPLPGLDMTALVALAVTWIGWLADAPPVVVGAAALVAAGAHAVRLWRWDPWSTRDRPILWILHLSYAWMPIGFALLAGAMFGLAGSSSFAVHAFTTGVIGGMTIGMMTRTARGHTGMPLQVGRVEVTSYLLVHAGAAFRVFGPFLLPSGYAEAIVASAVCWSAAFVLYLTAYWPLLTRPRIDGKPG